MRKKYPIPVMDKNSKAMNAGACWKTLLTICFQAYSVSNTLCRKVSVMGVAVAYSYTPANVLVKCECAHDCPMSIWGLCGTPESFTHNLKIQFSIISYEGIKEGFSKSVNFALYAFDFLIANDILLELFYDSLLEVSSTQSGSNARNAR